MAKEILSNKNKKMEDKTMKKIILGVVAASLLAIGTTNLFGAESGTNSSVDFIRSYISQDKEVLCKGALDPKNLGGRILQEESVCANDDLKYSLNLLAYSQGAGKAYTKIYGALSYEFLRNAGIGIKTSFTWENLLLNFAKGLCQFNDKERVEISLFLMSEFNKSRGYNLDDKKDIIVETMVIDSGYSEKNLDFLLFESFVKRSTKNLDNFVTEIAKDRPRKALEIAQRANAKSGILEIYQRDIMNGSCKNPKIRTIEDLRDDTTKY